MVDHVYVKCPCGNTWNFTYDQMNFIMYNNVQFKCTCDRVLQVTSNGQLNFVVELPSKIE